MRKSSASNLTEPLPQGFTAHTFETTEEVNTKRQYVEAKVLAESIRIELTPGIPDDSQYLTEGQP